MRGDKKRVFKADSELSICMERLGSEAEELAGKFTKLFIPVVNSGHDLCGNVRVVFQYGMAKLCNSSLDEPNCLQSYEQISSPLALYRAVSVFKAETRAAEQDFYKCNWSVTLVHKPSGKILMLGEWKGGFQIFTEGYSVDKLPKKFVKDVEAFLTWFVSNQVPIGYDGVVAGSVA